MAIISFEVAVDDLESVLAVYDTLQVWRSTDPSGVSPPYEEITDATALPAVLDGGIAGPWNLHGTSLGISLSGAPVVTVSFTDDDPYSLSQIIDQINAAIAGLASQIPVNTNQLRLTSPTTGTGASIVVSGSAVSILGLASKANGKSARPILNSPTKVYSFRDFDGSLAYWYKTRFYSSQTKAGSTFSVPREGAPQSVLSSFVAKAKVFLADGSGTPLIGRRVIFVPMSVKTVDVGSGISYGTLPGVDRLEVATDDTGYAEMSLVIGATYRVFFEGTSYQREFVVPDADFNLLSVLSTAPDVFSIVKTPPMPIRMS